MLERISQTLAQQQLTKNRSVKQNGTPREKKGKNHQMEMGKLGRNRQKVR